MKDERIHADVLKTNSISYRIIWIGLFVVLLYRWFILKEGLAETGDIFIVWILASIINFLMLAIRGIPPHYPASLGKKEELILLFTIPAASGILSVILTAIRGELTRFIQALTIFGLVYVVLFIMFALYGLLVHLWEKRNLDHSET